MSDSIGLPNGQFPEDVELCKYNSLTCNPILKVDNYYKAAPYNFFLIVGIGHRPNLLINLKFC